MRAAVRRNGDGRMMRGVEGGTESCRRRRGREVDGEGGSRVRMGVGEVGEDVSRGKRDFSPSGRRWRISESASLVS